MLLKMNTREIYALIAKRKSGIATAGAAQCSADLRYWHDERFEIANIGYLDGDIPNAPPASANWWSTRAISIPVTP
jgi:hypothetical protein